MGGIESHTLPTVHNLGKVVAKGSDEKTALKSFEAYFLGEMLRRTASKDTTGLMSGGQAGRMYQDHLYQEIGRIVAEQGDFGFAKSLEGKLGARSDDAAGEDDMASEKLPNKKTQRTPGIAPGHPGLAETTKKESQ